MSLPRSKDKSCPDRIFLIENLTTIPAEVATISKAYRPTKCRMDYWPDVLLQMVQQKFLDRPNDTRDVVVPELSPRKEEMMRLLYEGKFFQMRLTKEYHGDIRVQFGMITGIMTSYLSVEEALEHCGDDLQYVLSISMDHGQVFADANEKLHIYDHFEESDEVIYEAWVCIKKILTNKVIVEVKGVSIVDKNTVSWSDPDYN